MNCDGVLTRCHSPYLAAGIISARECVRATMNLSGSRKPAVDASRESGVGRGVQELGQHRSERETWLRSTGCLSFICHIHSLA